MSETSTIDKLFLELSQFTKARTGREAALTEAYDAMATKLDRYGLALMMIHHGCADPARVAQSALEKDSGGLADATPRTQSKET